MANYFQREPIDGDDSGVWGVPELRQNRAGTIGHLTANIYDDSGTLKVSKGLIGFDNDSRKGVAIIDTITTISIAALTASRWALVEMTVSGTTPSFSITSLAAENDPGSIPADLIDNYDPEKQGFYKTSTQRIIGLVWINSGGTLEGIVNCLSYVDGYQGYSTTDDALDQIYRWEKNVNNTVDGNYVGRLHIIPEDERPSAWVLDGGTAVAWTDVDFSAYVPEGVTALLLKCITQLVGNGAADNSYTQVRPNGSSETGVPETAINQVRYDNLGAGLFLNGMVQALVLCDSDGIVEYQNSDAQGKSFLNIVGYVLKENAG